MGIRRTAFVPIRVIRVCFLVAALLLLTTRVVPLFVTIFIAQPRQQRISTAIGARRGLFVFITKKILFLGASLISTASAMPLARAHTYNFFLSIAKRLPFCMVWIVGTSVTLALA
jgi:hypothetical protein